MNPLKNLIDQIYYVKEKSPFYMKKFADLPEKSSFDLSNYKRLPFTSKEDLAENNEAFLCVPKNEIAEYVTTSGTTGDPISLYLTQGDLKRLAKNERDSLALMGNSKDDLFQLLTTIDKQFMAGLAYFLGVQELGAGMIRIGPGVPQLQWDSILKYQPTKLIAVPSFVITLIDYAKENNIDFNKSSVEAIVCIGEPIRTESLEFNTLGKRITDNWEVELYSTYASTEMGAAFSECIAQNGCHLNEDLLYLEVLKEDESEALDGEVGEIVISTLNVEGTPLIRYKTGDIAHIYREPCSCGRTSPRLGPIVGRKQQMLKFKGTTLFPKAIFEVLDSFKEINCYKVIVKQDEFGNDGVTVLLDEMINNSSTYSMLIEKCKSQLRVIPNFEFMAMGELRDMVFKNHLRKPEKIKFI